MLGTILSCVYYYYRHGPGHSYHIPVPEESLGGHQQRASCTNVSTDATSSGKPPNKVPEEDSTPSHPPNEGIPLNPSEVREVSAPPIPSAPSPPAKPCIDHTDRPLSIDLSSATRGDRSDGADQDEKHYQQEKDGKNAKDKSVVYTPSASSHHDSYPGIAKRVEGHFEVQQVSADDDHPNGNNNYSPSGEAANMRTDDRFSLTLGNSGTHPNPSTAPFPCSGR